MAAVKKKAAKKKAPAKKSASKAMVSMADFEKQMAAQANTDSARVGSGADGSFLSIKGGSFTFQEADLGTEFEVVILDFVNEKAYYDGPYDSDNPSSPACWAITHDDPSEMVPHPDSPAPQCESCAECWANEFGSADTGRGKACKDQRKLLMAAADDFAEETPDKEIAFMRVPPTSLKAFDKFIKGLGKLSKRPCYGVTTDMSVTMDDDYPKLHFVPNQVIGDVAFMQEIMDMREQHCDSLMETYDPANYEEPKAKGPRKKAGAKKKAAPKKKGRGSKFTK